MFWMWAGLLFGTTITSLFRVKTIGLEQRLFWKSWSGSAMLAEANTSAGAPWVIWAASAFEPPNEYFSFGSIAGKTLVSEAAAKTVICVCAADAGPPAETARKAREATIVRSARRLRRIGTG